MAEPLQDDLARRAADLEARALAGHPESWRPDDPARMHPQQLTGQLVRVDDGTTAFGPAKIVVLQDLNGTQWGVWLIHTVLRNELVKQRPKIGDLVTIAYGGRVRAKNPQPGKSETYESYTVAVERADGGTVDWDAVSDDREVRPFAGAPVEVVERIEPQPASVAETQSACEACGMLNGHHATNCPFDIPF